MTDEQLIEKAKKILDYYKINYKNRTTSIYKPTEIDPIYEKLGLDRPSLDIYTVFFNATEQIMPGINLPSISLKVHKDTYKIFEVISKHYLHTVPEELQ